MVGIDADEDSARVQEFVERYDIAGPVVYQPSPGSSYGVSGYLTNYFLDDEVVTDHSGEAPREVYECWIGDALGSGFWLRVQSDSK